MSQRWGIPKTVIILSILFMAGLCVTVFMQGLAYSEGLAMQATQVSGTLSENTTWTAVNSPYVITGMLTIPDGIILTIDAGVTVQVDGIGYAAINVESGGHLAVNGTLAEPITFTSLSDSGQGEWTSIVVVGSAQFRHTHFRNSEFNLDIIGATGGQIVVEDCLINYSSKAGMFVAVDALHRLEMTNVTFSDNVENRIRLMHYFENDQVSGDAVLKPMPGLEGYEYYPDTDDFWNVSPILKVPEGITLTIEPDTTLLMPEDGILKIDGHLQAVGELGHSVTFRPTGDVLSNPLADPWTGIVFDITGTGNLSYAHFQEAGVAVGVFGASNNLVNIENSLLANGYLGALASPDALHRLNIKNVTFENNELNYIGLEVGEGYDTFVDDIVLTNQPGLEGYQISTGEFFPHDKLVIPEGVNLRMDPGSTLLMADSMRLEVEGTLQINGTAQQAATIQSDSPGNEWTGITLNGGLAILNHGQLMDAETAVSLQSSSSTLTITNTTFTQNQTGILANTGSVTATCAIFSNNTRGVYLNPDGTGEVNILQSSLSGNTTAGIDNEGTSLINAVNNWWGAADGPSGDGSGSGDAVYGNVLYEPWQEQFECNIEPNNQDEWTMFLPMVIYSKHD